MTKAIPSPLVAIVVVTSMTLGFGIHVHTVADLGEMPRALPPFALPHVPLTFETLKIIFPYSVALAAVGLLESLLTVQIVEDLTDTPSNKSKECVGQGDCNTVSALFGGMGGCAMLGQSAHRYHVRRARAAFDLRRRRLPAGVALGARWNPVCRTGPLPLLVLMVSA